MFVVLVVGTWAQGSRVKVSSSGRSTTDSMRASVAHWLALSLLSTGITGLVIRPGVCSARHLAVCRSTLTAVVTDEQPCQDEEGIRADAATAFRMLDLNGDGEISAAEFTQYLLQFRYTEAAIGKIIGALDTDGNGSICINELREGIVEYCRCEACEPKFVTEIEAQADEMFEVIDTDGNGAISSSELKAHLLEMDYSEEAVVAVFRSLDSNNDGELSKDELRAGFLSYSRLRQAMVAVVTTLVKRKQWASKQ